MIFSPLGLPVRAPDPLSHRGGLLVLNAALRRVPLPEDRVLRRGHDRARRARASTSSSSAASPMPITPSPAPGVIARVLDAEGLKVGVIERPDWKGDADFRRSARRGSSSGSRPGRSTACSSITRRSSGPGTRTSTRPTPPACPTGPSSSTPTRSGRSFPGVPIVLGGIEASLRRFAHYDYWDDKVRRSLLLDSRADILVYGPGELQAVEIARRLERGEPIWPASAARASSRARLPAGFERSRPTRTSRRPGSVLPGPERVFEPPGAGPAPRRAASSSSIPCRSTRPPTSTGSTACRSRADVPAHFPEFKMAQFSVVTHRGCFGALLVLLALPPSGRPDRLAERGIDPRRDPAPDRASRFQGLHRRPGRADGQHVRHGLRRRASGARAAASTAGDSSAATAGSSD